MKELRPLASLQAKAPKRKPGYLDACLALGKLDPKTQMVSFTPQAWLKIRQEYAIPRKPCPFAPNSKLRQTIESRLRPDRSKLRLGDAIAKVATPIARALKMDCIDPATGRLKPDSGCFRRKTLLNKIKLPFAS